MAQDLAFSDSIRTGVGSALGAVSIALAGCVPNTHEVPQALSDAQRQVCVQEGIDNANKILEGRRQNEGKGWLNKVYTPQGTATEQDIYMALQRQEQAKCEQETRDGRRKHSEDRGTVYPAHGTLGQADPAAPAPAASAPEVVVVPVPVPEPAPKELPPESVLDKGEVILPSVPAASAPAPDAPASAAQGSRSFSDYILHGKRGAASAPEGQSR